jgi:hypothetical protein
MICVSTGCAAVNQVQDDARAVLDLFIKHAPEPVFETYSSHFRLEGISPVIARSPTGDEAIQRFVHKGWIASLSLAMTEYLIAST